MSGFDITKCPRDGDDYCVIDSNGRARRVVIDKDWSGLEAIVEKATNRMWLFNGRWLRIKHADLVGPDPSMVVIPVSLVEIEKGTVPIRQDAVSVSLKFNVSGDVKIEDVRSFLHDEFTNWLKREVGGHDLINISDLVVS